MAPRAIKSAVRTLAVFELFAARQGPLRVRDVAQTLDIPQPSASGLLSNLVELGYLERHAQSRTYQPTLRILLLGGWLGHKLGATRDLSGHLRRLRRELDETVTACAQLDSHVQFILVQGAGHPDRANVESSVSVPLTRTAPGHALLALKPDSEVKSWVRRCSAEEEEERRVSLSEFAETIQKVRRSGYSETHGCMHPDIAGLAVAFHLPVMRQPIAISIGMPIRNIERKREVALAALFDLKRAFTEAPIATSDLEPSPIDKKKYGAATAQFNLL